MKRKIEYSPGYSRQAKKIAKKYPHLKKTYTNLLEKLLINPFDPALHTHPLKGSLKGKTLKGFIRLYPFDPSNPCEELSLNHFTRMTRILRTKSDQAKAKP